MIRGVLIGVLALFALASPAQAQGKGDLKSALAKCSPVRDVIERLKCYDKLARDVREYDEIVAETCNCSKKDDGVAALSPLAPVAPSSTPVPGAARRAGQSATAAAPKNETAAQAEERQRRTQTAGLREAFGAGKWKAFPLYKDSGELISHRIELIAEKDISGSQSQKATRPVYVINCSDQGTEVWMETSFTSAGDNTAVTSKLDDEEPTVRGWANHSSGRFMGIWKNGEPMLLQMMGHDRLEISFTPKDARPTTTWFDIRGLSFAIKPIRNLCIW